MQSTDDISTQAIQPIFIHGRHFVPDHDRVLVVKHLIRKLITKYPNVEQTLISKKSIQMEACALRNSHERDQYLRILANGLDRFDSLIEERNKQHKQSPIAINA